MEDARNAAAAPPLMLAFIGRPLQLNQVLGGAEACRVGIGQGRSSWQKTNLGGFGPGLAIGAATLKEANRNGGSGWSRTTSTMPRRRAFGARGVGRCMTGLEWRDRRVSELNRERASPRGEPRLLGLAIGRWWTDRRTVPVGDMMGGGPGVAGRSESEQSVCEEAGPGPTDAASK